MSPTDQPDGRTSATLKVVSSLPASSSNARWIVFCLSLPSNFDRQPYWALPTPPLIQSGSSGAADSKPISANEAHEGPSTNILVISPAYLKCHEKRKGYDESGKEKLELKPLELKSTRNDLEIQLPQHDTTNGTRRVFICADHPHRYEESENTRIRGASRSDILDCLAEAVSLGGSLVIFYSGHGGRTGGKWAATFNDGHWEYEEENAKKEGTKKDEATKPELPYILSSDCQRIYGKDVAKALSAGLEQNGGRKMTIMLIFDTCHAATFFDNSLVLPYVYRPEALGGLKVEPHAEAQYGESQVIFLASTQLHQESGTFKKGEPSKEYGAVTWLMRQFLQDPNVPKTAEELIEWLYNACKARQTPQIRALHRINDLRLLRG